VIPGNSQAAALFAVALCAGISDAQASPFWQRESLSNGFGGVAAGLDERGMALAAVYTGEFARVLDGLESGHAYLDNVDITLETDMKKAFGIEGGTLFVYVLGNSGGSPSKLAGDMQTVSNIDAPDTWKVYELWYQQNWVEDRYSLKGGLYDFNSEFDVTETGALFLNSSFGIGPEIAQSGENGPSIFPTTSLALRGRFNASNGVYAQAVALDGVAGDPERANGTRIELDRDDGLLLATEVGHVRDADETRGYRKFALGSWRYTTAVAEDAAGVAISARENRGFYALAEGLLLAERGDPAQGLSGFLRYGRADDRINQLDSYFGAGVVYKGLLPGRDDDHAGIALARAGNADRFREQSSLQGSTLRSDETAIEISYRAQLAPWLALQPDYQYVIDPGGDPAIDDAHVLMLRVEIVL
jgi:porin